MPKYKMTSRGIVSYGDRLPPVHSTRRWTRAARRQVRRQPWCAECGSTENLTADHIVVLAAGGDPWSAANLQTLCATCNSNKGAL